MAENKMAEETRDDRITRYLQVILLPDIADVVMDYDTCLIVTPQDENKFVELAHDFVTDRTTSRSVPDYDSDIDNWMYSDLTITLYANCVGFHVEFLGGVRSFLLGRFVDGVSDVEKSGDLTEFLS